MKRIYLRWPMLIIIIAAAVAMSWYSTTRLSIETDITSSLPLHDPVIADARYVLMHHPVKDRIVIDLGTTVKDTNLLIDAAGIVERRLESSGLFKSVGMKEFQVVMPLLVTYVTETLPLLFTADELERGVAPLLTTARVKESLAAQAAQLADLQGIGQSSLIAADPLGLRNLVLARMAHLAPTRDVQIIAERLVSPDGRHLLIMAEPRGSGTDTVIARRIAGAIDRCRADLKTTLGARARAVTLTPVGGYRAALDNEDTAKSDTRKAVIFATLGIILLLLVGFPRPYIGLLALVPAVLGTIAASFVYALTVKSISILAVGFGGAIISFTVDYGIAYLLFLDQPHETRGLEATREVWALGLLAMLTTAASFAFLFISGFPALAQIGAFTALGVVFTYIFVHALFPMLFPVMPAARRGGFLPLQKLVKGLLGSGGWPRLVAAAVLGLIMLAFARPDFRVDLASMNTVSRETMAAEGLVTKTWGNVFSRLYLMTEAPSLESLQEKSDRLADGLAADVNDGILSAAFVPSLLFPGPERSRQNLAAWKSFWSRERVAALRRALGAAGTENGFAPRAFDGFFTSVTRPTVRQSAIPSAYYGILGIAPLEKNRGWAQFSVLTPGTGYAAPAFHDRMARMGLARVFDPVFFSDRLGAIILESFIKMAVIVGIVTFIVALIYLLDIPLTIIALAPTVLSLVATLGTLKLLGIQPGIPTIIVTVIIIGMGSDYALYLVRANQTYLDINHPSVDLIRMTVFLSAVSTLVGFGVLGLADHALLRNAGITIFLGIGYALLGTALIVPPIMKRLFAAPPERGGPALLPANSAGLRRGVLRRYRHLEPYPRLFARVKMRLDPLFAELPGLVASPRVILDLGTGYGLPAAWLLGLFPEARVHGLEPNEGRRRVAAWVLGNQGTVSLGAAPELPELPGTVDTALAIDMIHYLDDEAAVLTLERVRLCLAPDGRLLLRATVPLQPHAPLRRRIELAWVRRRGLAARFRTIEALRALMEEAGFTVAVTTSGAGDREEFWFTGTAPARRRPAGRRKSTPRRR